MKIKAITQFAHGDWHADAGDEHDLPEGAARGLIAAGLCEAVAPEPEPAADQAEDVKASPTPKNKAAPAADNKSA